jgi:hypothetical protein
MTGTKDIGDSFPAQDGQADRARAIGAPAGSRYARVVKKLPINGAARTISMSVGRIIAKF